VDKGNRCKQLIESQAFKEINKEIAEQLFNEFNICILDKEKLFDIKMLLEGSKKFISYIYKNVNDGEIANKDLLKLKEKGK
jgi:hypothetical protein